MHLPLRELFSISDSDSRFNTLKNLEQIGFIDTVQKKKVTCNKCDRQIPIPSLHIENNIRCPTCEKFVSLSKLNIEYSIEKINYNLILEKIEELVKNSGYDYEYNKENIIWKIKIKEKIIPLIIPYVSNSNFLLAHSEKEAIMFLSLDNERISTFMNVMNISQFLEFQTIYDDPLLFVKTLNQISEIFDQNYALSIEPKFDDMLNKISGFKFEEFCVDFLKSIKEHHEKLSSFFSYLNLRKDTIINSKIIKLGGPGASDFVLIRLNEYLQSGLRPELFGESKKYKKSKFTIEDFSKAIIHANTQDVLFIVSTDNVQKEVWEKILSLRKNGKFRFILFDKDIILTLIKCLDLTYLVDNYRNKD